MPCRYHIKCSPSTVWFKSRCHIWCPFVSDWFLLVHMVPKCSHYDFVIRRRWRFVLNGPRCEKNRSSGFPTRSDTNRAVQPQKMARSLKFRITVEEGVYYPYCENKGADQLRSYCATDLRLCFRICKKPVFSRRGSNYTNIGGSNTFDFMGKFVSLFLLYFIAVAM